MTLQDLLTRVEQAQEGSRELDAEIAVALRYGGERYPNKPLGTFSPGHVQADLGRDGWSVGWTVPAFTTSLDAALALIERKLPGWWWEVAHGTAHKGAGPYWASVYNNETLAATFDGTPDEAPGKTPALALVAALLRALSSQETKETERG